MIQELVRSSASMETNIVSEGFCLSERHHGVRYMRVTVNGDSSVMATLIQSVQYGPFIQKIECANCAYKCYRIRLESFAKDHPQFTGKGGLTKCTCHTETNRAWAHKWQ